MKLEITADLLDELAKSKGLDIGQVYVNEMPLGIKHGLLLMDSYAGTPINPYMPKLRNTGLRLIMRSSRYARGYKTAMLISELLNIQVERYVEGANVKELLGEDSRILLKQVLVMNEPKPYRSSDGGFVEFEMEIELIYVAPELHSPAVSP